VPPGRALSKLGIGAKDIFRLSVTIERFEQEKEFSKKAGSFLSMLVDRCEESDIVIQTSHLSKPIDKLGFMNKRDILIDGDAGKNLGWGMESGSIRVTGDAGDFPGYRMRGGSIEIAGNAGVHVGKEMEGGSITVNGDAIYGVGSGMKGGIVRIKGDSHGPILLDSGQAIIQGDALEATINILGGEVHLEGELTLGDDVDGNKTITARGTGQIYHKGKQIGDREIGFETRRQEFEDALAEDSEEDW
jgi:formylmethanofuran dehydrogenase subunit C